jgi:DNA-binding MarR family transcriptional regulator
VIISSSWYVREVMPFAAVTSSLLRKTGRDGDERAGLTELEERLKLGKSTVTELVLRSEERGLVRRELNQKRRGTISIRTSEAD